nr:MAG TPA: hypothetical protein [Caudoviricetes sp.]
MEVTSIVCLNCPKKRPGCVKGCEWLKASGR